MMSSGATTLSAQGHDLRQTSRDVTSAGAALSGAAGEAGLAGSVDRLTAALATSVHDSGVQATAAAELAKNAAGDLDRATGGGHGV